MTKDKVIPESKWEFDEQVADVFENMLQRSIPQYDVMRVTTADIACKFLKPNDVVIDLGCSDGMAIGRLFNRLGNRNRYIGVDTSEPMLEKARERFCANGDCVTIIRMDLKHQFPEYYAGVIQSILTLSFIPLEYRQSVVSNCYKWLKPEGALVVVEKLLGETAELDEIYVERYMNMKREHNYSEEEIIRKKLSLEGVLMPLTANWNQQLFKAAGFRYVDCYWRWMNFAGFVAVK